MIGLKGTLNVIDNSGAIIAECIRVMNGARFARAGKEEEKERKKKKKRLMINIRR